jgi:lipopolysaccharide export system permease protein
MPSVTLLDRYVGRTILAAFVLVLLALLPLFTILDLVQQLDDVGKGSYGFLDAVRYELMMLPRRGLDLLPFAALIATTVGLALLSHFGETIAMRACGVSRRRIALSVVKVGLGLMLLAAVAEELIASPLHRQATQERAVALAGREVLLSEDGFWMHSGSSFVSIGRVLHGHVPQDVDILEQGEDRRLQRFIHAREADIADPERWVLKDVVVKQLGGGAPTSERLPELPWDSYLSLRQVELLQLAPQVMSPLQLHRYTRYLRESGQRSEQYELAFWQKVTLPLFAGAMVMLALPAAFGLPRSADTGKRIFLAVAFGLAFQVVSQLLASAGLVLSLPAPLVTLGPLVLLFAGAFVLLWRERT